MFVPCLIDPRSPKRRLSLPLGQERLLHEARPVELQPEDYHHPFPVKRIPRPLWILGIDDADGRIMLQFDLRSPLCYWRSREKAEAFLEREREKRARRRSDAA